MEFEFGKYTEITDLVFKLRPELKKEGYIRFFICPDVWDNWFARILKDVNGDYNHEEGSYLLERDKIAKDYKGQDLTIGRVKKIIVNDDLSNWDFEQANNVNEAIEMLDDGFGILNLQTETP